MLNHNMLAIFIGSNALLFLIIHIPLDILTYLSKENKYKEGAKDYPAWDKSVFIKIITIFTSLLFWLFFLVWPILHLVGWDGFVMFFNFNIPYVGDSFQIIGMVLVALGTLIAIVGRISRGSNAVSWGVPKELTTKGGFKIIRHPLYASYCYYFIGIPLAMLNFILIPLLLGIIGYYFTAVYEEKILLEEFGEEYINYQEKVGMLMPFIGRKRIK